MRASRYAVVMSLADDDARDRAVLHKRMLWPLAVCTGAYIVAYCVQLLFIESVMGSGPALSGLGIWLVVRAARARRAAAVLLGAGLAVLSLTLFITVNALSWSPSDARHPFAIIGAALGVVVVVLAVLALREPRAPKAVELVEALRHTAG